MIIFVRCYEKPVLWTMFSMFRAKQVLSLKIKNVFLQNYRKLSSFSTLSSNKAVARNVELLELQESNSVSMLFFSFFQKNCYTNAPLILWWTRSYWSKNWGYVIKGESYHLELFGFPRNSPTMKFHSFITSQKHE